MTKKIENVTHPPKVDVEAIYRRFTKGEASILRGLYKLLEQLNDEPWIDDDYYDEGLKLWWSVTGTAFRDTLPTYTVTIDGEPITGDMTAKSVEQLNEVRSPAKCEEILQAEPITIFGMEPNRGESTDLCDDATERRTETGEV